MATAIGKIIKVGFIGIILLFILWMGHSSNAAPRAYHYLTKPKQKPDNANNFKSEVDLADYVGDHKFAEPNDTHMYSPTTTSVHSMQIMDTNDHISQYLHALKTSLATTTQIITSTRQSGGPATPPPIAISQIGGSWSKNDTNEVTERIGTFIEGQNITDYEVIDYLESVLDLDSEVLPRMKCPGEREPHLRYRILQETGLPGIQYFFSLNLYQAMPIMNRLMASIIRAVRFLGPERCGISIVEGRSTDGTYVVLDHLRVYLEDLGVKFWLDQSDVNPKEEGNDRIELLSGLRNLALEPILKADSGLVEHPQIIFLNDITCCPDDILELIYQHKLQNATQTCAMDWAEHGENFYDVWVSRTMTGNLFFEIPQSGSWEYVQNLFFDDPYTKKKFKASQPFQVFSCWGGMSVIEAAPFIENDLRFRRSVEGECFGGEPQLLAMDMARLGINKVQAIPAVNVAYDSNEVGADTKKIRGYVHEKVDVLRPITSFDNDTQTDRVHWKPPPYKIRCMPNLGDIFWVDNFYDPAKPKDE